MASAITTYPVVVQRDSTTRFHPALKFHVPMVRQAPPPDCWFTLTRPTSAPLAL